MPWPKTFNMRAIRSDVAGVADIQDPLLVNPWGVVVHNNTVWVANNATSTLESFSRRGSIEWPAVTTSINTTGIAINDTRGFVITNGPVSKCASLVGVTEDGAIWGYNSAVNPVATIEMVAPSTNVYKGVAVSGKFLYATNFNGSIIDKYDASFNLVASFTDPALMATGYAPFGITSIRRKLYVSYAKQDALMHDDVAGVGNGYVNIFDRDGRMLERFTSRGALNSPWSLVKYCTPSKDLLLVGNFGNGMVNAFDLECGEYMGPLVDSYGNPWIIDGLWGLATDSKKELNDTDNLFFTAGINSENNGLFGTLRAKCGDDSDSDSSSSDSNSSSKSSRSSRSNRSKSPSDSSMSSLSS